MIENLIAFEEWAAPNPLDLVKEFIDKQEKKEIDVSGRPLGVSWTHFQGELSPLQVYTYLKARFGPPNGTMMIFKHPSTNNLTHWHYEVHGKEVKFNFFGHARGLEVMIRTSKEEPSLEDRKIFVSALKKEFVKYGKEISRVRNNYEQWTLIINPFVRLYQTIHQLIDELIEIDLTEPPKITHESTTDERKIYKKALEKWSLNISRAAALGTTLRMLFPVMLESFINLTLYMFRKQELKEDSRLYNAQVKQQIDLRVKLLHLNCDGFEGPINGNDDRFKNFHSLMNGRNDFLHGNIEMNYLKLEDFYMEDPFIPLFEEDEGAILRNLRKLVAKVEIDKVLEEEKVVEEFIGMVLEQLKPDPLKRMIGIMGERYPAINKKTNHIAAILPIHTIESFAFSEKKLEDDSDYHWCVSEDGRFEVYLPIYWRIGSDQNHYTFEPVTKDSKDYPVISIQDFPEFRIAGIKKWLSRFKMKKVGDSVLYISSDMELNAFTYTHYMIIIDNTYIRITWTIPTKKSVSSEPLEAEVGQKEMERIFATLKIIPAQKRKETLSLFRYLNFIKGMAMIPLLVNNAFKNKAYFEASTVLCNQIDAFLRIGIVLKQQLIDRTNEIEDKWIYQSYSEPIVTSAKVIEKAKELEVVDEALLKKAVSLLEARTDILENFILTIFTVVDVERIANALNDLCHKLADAIEILEKEQAKVGVGLGKDGFASQKRLFADAIKSRIASDAHFEALMLFEKEKM